MTKQSAPYMSLEKLESIFPANTSQGLDKKDDGDIVFAQIHNAKLVAPQGFLSVIKLDVFVPGEFVNYENSKEADLVKIDNGILLQEMEEILLKELRRHNMIKEIPSNGK